MFVVNKGVSMAAACCFGLAFWQQWRRIHGAGGGIEPAVWFRAGSYGVICHVPMSLAILRPSYFQEFFLPGGGDRMNFQGEAVCLFGALTAGGVYLLTRSQWTPLQRWWLSLAMITVLFCHTLCMGIARGLNINASHGYLPPMWLLSLLGIVGGACFLLGCRPGRPAAEGADVERPDRPAGLDTT